MQSYSYRPGPPLSEFVDQLWLYEASASPTHTPSREKILPTGSMSLIINLTQDRIRIYETDDPGSCQELQGSIIAGSRSEYSIIDSPDRFCMIGVEFKPAGAFPFFRPPASELQNATVPLGETWGREGALVRERLLEQQTVQGKFAVLEQTLLSQARERLRNCHPAVAFALDRLRTADHSGSVSQVVDEIGISQRRFIQVFSEQVGLTPKLFSRVQRFQKMLAHVFPLKEVDWADVASMCGYYDQSHFIHDFKSFSGLSPTAYLASRSRFQNHIPLSD